jgi:hypothetical protein
MHFCDFSKIVGFPNPVPSRDEWERSIPRFRGEEWEVPAEHLLDFHDFIHRLEIVHEDVQIKLFRYSLEGIALDWCQSLPIASINSLADFHAAFHLFCKGIFSADLLYPECCHDFNLLNKDPNIHEDFAAAEDISHHDQGIVDPHYDNHGDAFDIVLNASMLDGCHEDQTISFENFKDDEQIDTSAEESYRSELQSYGKEELIPHNLHHFSNDLHEDVLSHQHKLEMDYKGDECLLTIIKSDCCESEELVSLTTHGNDQLSVGQMTIEISEAIPQFSDLQTKESGSNHEEQNFQG